MSLTLARERIRFSVIPNKRSLYWRAENTVSTLKTESQKIEPCSPGYTSGKRNAPEHPELCVATGNATLKTSNDSPEGRNSCLARTTVPAGQTLKSLRNKRHITVRDVEQASRRIADVKGDKRFCISNGWLAQLENGVSEPSICKLFSLSVIYHANFLDLVRLYEVDVDDKEKYEPVADPHLTQLISVDGNGDGCSMSGASSLSTSLVSELEAMSARQLAGGEDHVPSITYAHLGSSDFTMYPMIRPGALLKIDMNQNKLAAGEWHNEYERPIFFVELRQAYACGWCELQGNQLLIIPHPSSPASVRRFTYPREAEIVGRVVGYSTQCINADPPVAKVRNTKRVRDKNS
jgi:transcriptional regulator with XRE-family HTH domain